MWSNSEILFRFVGFLSTRGVRIGKRITSEKAWELIDAYELSDWSLLDDNDKAALRDLIAQRESKRND